MADSEVVEAGTGPTQDMVTEASTGQAAAMAVGVAVVASAVAAVADAAAVIDAEAVVDDPRLDWAQSNK